jgi:hypothetical protein
LSLRTHFGRPSQPDRTAATRDDPAADAPTADELTTDGEPAEGGGEPADGGGDGRRRWRTAGSWTLTALAALFLLAALLLPNSLLRPTPWAFVRLPIEPLLGVAVLLALRPGVRRWVALAAGVGLGLLVIMKIADIGFYATLNRPFNLVLDWELLDDSLSFLQDSVGRFGGLAAAAGVVVLAAGVVALGVASVRRLTRLVVQHGTAAIRTVLVLGVVWVTLFAVGVQHTPELPVATRNTVSYLHTRSDQVRVTVRDQQQFTAQAKVDAFRDVPGNQLLTALRGKDVIISFVESYGRSAVQDPRLARTVGPVLDAGTGRLKAAGFGARSGFLTSPTSGGNSWLGHSTFLSGLWIDNNRRYRTLLASDRLTLTRCFQRADWRTVSFEPATVKPFPEIAFYGYDQAYTFNDFGYRGPQFSWSTMPDQYALEGLHKREHSAAGRGPLLAEITLTSSHTPWAPQPTIVDWDALGDGSVFGPMQASQDNASELWKKGGDQIRAAYSRSVAYSLESVISYVERYGDDKLVLIFLGDHQPAPLVTGGSSNRDVPITIVTRDPAVLGKIAGWGWQDGLRPGPQAPVWRMDSFRDRFLTTFK